MSKLRDPLAQPVERPAGGVDIREFWRVLVERRGVVMACVGATVLVVMLATFLQTPLYLASATLMVERHGPDFLTFQDVLSVDPYGYREFYETQYKVIQSRTVARLAAERLDLPSRPEFVNRRQAPLGRLLGWLGSPSSGDAPADDPLEAATDFVAGGLAVTPVRNSHLVVISFMDSSPELARDVTQAVSAAYQQFQLEARNTTTEQASEFLTKEVARLQSEIAQREVRLQEYGSEKAILTLNEGSEDISEQALAGLNSRLTEAKGRMAVARARYEKLEQVPPEALPEVLSSPLVNHLKQQYAEVERRHSQVAERFKPGWPERVQLEQELAQARQRLSIETAGIAEQVRGVARAGYELAQAEVAHLEQQVEQQKREVQRVHREAIAYAGLRSEIVTRRKVLAELVARQSETETSEHLRDTPASNIRVVEPARTPEVPARPRKLVNLFLAILLGTGLGVGLVLVLHHVDNTIKNEQDIERYGSGVAVLGHVSLLEPLTVVHGGKTEEEGEGAAAGGAPLPPSPGRASHELPRSAFAESFKNLRTALLLAAPDRPPRYLHITSCEPKDGKSTVAMNLAIVLAQMGRGVLLIDADLRRPRLHRALALSNDVGLSNFLTGNAAFDRLRQETSIPGLDLITSGPTPPNPSELLGSPAFANLLNHLDGQERYAHVIFDSPPTIQVADSLILADKVDATILVVRSEKTSRESLGEGLGRLRHARARIAGAVLNAVPEKSRHYYHYRRYSLYYHDEETTGHRGSAGALVSLSEKVKRGWQRRVG